MSKKILFHAEQLNYRGTTNSILDYAKYNQEILGNQSAILYSAKDPDGADVGSDANVIDQLTNQFQLYKYETHQEANEIASNFDLCYSQRAGLRHDFRTQEPQLMINTTQFGVHCVFQWYDPHGDRYAYISEWLAKKVARDNAAPEHEFVPYVVHLPPPNYDTRSHLGISKDKFVIGRSGGFNTFDIPFVKDTVRKVLENHEHIVFLFANTEKFIDHPRAIFMPPFFGQQQKSNYINACDAMLHARTLGESFGLAMCEFLFWNKPVLAWEGGFDRNHIELLKGHDLIYSNENDLYKRILSLPDFCGKNYRSIVNPFGPYAVMKKFQAVYLL
jgi:glycosyltransferase involved in cell wall biosynthesis